MEFTKDINFSNVLEGNKVSKITYSGDLYKKGSDFVSIVYGFGENWDFTTEQEMVKVENGFSADVEMKTGYTTFNFCFKNNNGEWDNNNYANYISTIQESTDTNVNTEEVLDSDLILDILDSLLEENFSKIDEVTTSGVNTEKQQILNDILSEGVDTVQGPVLAEDFNMDELIETILNPVINFDNLVEEEPENILTFKETTEADIDLFEELKNDLEKTLSEFSFEPQELIQKAETEKEETGLVVKEDSYLVSPRKLRKAYMFIKKIKLVFLKVFVGIPKLLFDSFEENGNH